MPEARPSSLDMGRHDPVPEAYPSSSDTNQVQCVCGGIERYLKEHPDQANDVQVLSKICLFSGVQQLQGPGH